MVQGSLEKETFSHGRKIRMVQGPGWYRWVRELKEYKKNWELKKPRLTQYEQQSRNSWILKCSRQTKPKHPQGSVLDEGSLLSSPVSFRHPHVLDVWGKGLFLDTPPSSTWSVCPHFYSFGTTWALFWVTWWPVSINAMPTPVMKTGAAKPKCLGSNSSSTTTIWSKTLTHPLSPRLPGHTGEG